MVDETSGITVVGVGTVRVPTTEAMLRLRVERRESAPGAALTEAGAIVAAAFEVLRQAGIPDTDVRTATVRVTANKAWVDNHEELQGYDAQQDLQVRVTDLAKLDELLGSLVDRCGTGLQIDDVSLSGEADAVARSQARQEAVRDAREKASEYATFAGRTLGRAESISEVRDRPAPLRRHMAMAASAGMAMPIAQGEEETTVAVEVRWSFGG
ncbi:SIMPL domain-containing protein [Flexivirga caeni]|uniref:DUF541 domain-containing protein n=1 Tax=Flexivirga caeni TaxID=2294115 RepID=A0A3M9MFM7_9MICO|nr:SIMPL domain-containing protein [Flexivirga caeni]RNI24346.1 DUF541 domain-containing protein [Flexivirga caeni]